MNWLDEAPPAGLIRAVAQHILSSRGFRAAPRLAGFLKFVVDATLEGRSGSIKGYTIGVEALGRPITFDPSSDSIVRVEAVRLRAALHRYYLEEGMTQPVEISLPVGTYVPKFTWAREESAAAKAGGASAAHYGRSKADLVAPELFAKVNTAREIVANDLAVKIVEARQTLRDLRREVQALSNTREELATQIEEMEEKSRRK